MLPKCLQYWADEESKLKNRKHYSRQKVWQNMVMALLAATFVILFSFCMVFGNFRNSPNIFTPSVFQAFFNQKSILQR